MNIWKKIGFISTLIIVLMIPLSLLLHKTSIQEKKQAEFVGGKECISCHQREYELWKGSDHDNAMAVANDSTVLGDFNNVEVEFRGKKHKFYKRDGKFFVYTEGVGGEMKEFQVSLYIWSSSASAIFNSIRERKISMPSDCLGHK